MLLLVCSYLYWVPNFRRVDRVRHRSLVRQRLLEGCPLPNQRMSKPTNDAADNEPKRSDLKGCPAPPRAYLPEALRHRLIEDGIEHAMQPGVLLAVGCNAIGLFRHLRELSLDRAAVLWREPFVDIGVKVVLRGLHRTTFNVGVTATPVIKPRSRSRPRNSRDITVPIGMPRAWLTSA